MVLRVDLNCFFSARAVWENVGFLRREYVFCSSFDRSNVSSFSFPRSIPRVEFSQDFVVKTSRLSPLDIVLGCQLDPVLGFAGAQGELLNGLIAREVGAPSPVLLGACFDLARGKASIFFSRLNGFITLESWLREVGFFSDNVLMDVFDLFSCALSLGIYHADPNSSNIMFSVSKNAWRLIDFECCVPRGADLSLALALQVSSFWDARVRDILSRERLRAKLEGYLLDRFEVEVVRVAMREFDLYTLARPNRAARLRRLSLASAGVVDIRAISRVG